MARHIAGIERARFREITLEKRRVDVDAADDARDAEANDAPVEHAVIAAAARFPAVHPLAALRVFALAPDCGAPLDQVLLGREEFVVGVDHGRAEPLGRQIDEIDKRGHSHSRSPVGVEETVRPSQMRSPRR